MDYPTEKVISAYINLRDAIAEKRKQQEAELLHMEEQLEMLNQELLVRCEEAGGNISVPGVGRVNRRIDHQYWTNDCPAFYNMIKEHDAFHLLHKRLSMKAVREFLEENPDATPAGLNSDSKYVVTVTRAS